jgi:hypothetical protein
VVGIVRRPYPTASDQRWTILPRFPADVRSTGGSGPTGAGGTLAPIGVGGMGPNAAAGLAPTPPAGLDVDLVVLGGHVGDAVRVGGLVTSLAPDGFVLDDGTASGMVVLRGDAAELLPLLEPGDAVNASGTVEEVAGELAVVVTEAAGLALAGDLREAGLPGRTEPPSVGSEPPAGGATAAEIGELPGIGPGLAGLWTLLAVSAVSVAVTGLRRWQARRRLDVRVAARLARFAAPAPDDPAGDLAELVPPGRAAEGPRTAEHASRTHGSA